MGLFPGSQAPPMPSYLAPAFLTVQRALHTLHKILAVPGNPAWERREGSPNVCSSSKPVHTCSSPSLLLNSSSAHTFKSEMHNSVKSAGVRIYSQARKGCSTSLRRIHRRAENPRVEVKLARHARASCGLRIDSQERHTPPKHRKWITFSSHSPLCCFSRKMFPVAGYGGASQARICGRCAGFPYPARAPNVSPP